MKKLTTKIGMLIVTFLAVTTVFMFLFSDFLYERFYVQDSEQAMIATGTKLQTGYQSGPVTDEYVEQVEQFNRYSNYQVFAVRNPKELSACVPFDIDYDTLIGKEEREVLLKGEVVTKIGYVPRFDRQVISVVIPLVDQERLEGILYLYYPLTKITEMAAPADSLLVLGAILFLIVATVFVFLTVKRIMAPLRDLKHAVQKMSSGDYSARVQVKTQDEVGQVAVAFNEMAEVIQREDESQKTFLAIVSHELRTPISFVKGYSESIVQGLVDEQQKGEALQIIAREANRMERLTNDLMQLVRHEGERDLMKMPLVFSEVLRESIQLVFIQAQKKQIRIETDFDENLIVEGDEERLKQIFINVIENAIRYSYENSKITVRLFEQNKMAVVQLQDEGIGIAKEHVSKVTERFYRVNKARSRSDGGSGLGLSIASMLVQKHGGQLTIESEEGKGTLVQIEIPLMEE